MLETTEETTETRILIAALLHEQVSRLSRELRSLELPNGMTPERLSALSTTERHGPISINALADREMVGPASMSRMVQTLASEGLVQRSKSNHDRRTVHVTTTPNGRRIRRRAHEERLRHFAKALARLNDEELMTMRALTSLLEEFTLRPNAKT